LAVTNTFEGTIFVNLSTASTVQIPEYLVNLFPKLGEANVREGTAQYANLGSSIEQVIGIMGECEWNDTRRPFIFSKSPDQPFSFVQRTSCYVRLRDVDSRYMGQSQM